MPNVTDKNIQYPEDNAQAQSKQHLYHQHRNNFEKDPAREITGNKQKQHKQAKYDQKVNKCRSSDNNWQTDARKAEFLRILAFDKKTLTRLLSVSVNNPHVNTPEQR